MKKETLIKYIEGELDEQSERNVHRWLRKNDRNMEFFISLKALYVSVMMPDSVDTSSRDDALLKEIMSNKSGPRFKKEFSRIIVWTSAAAIFFIGILNLYYITRTTESKPTIEGRELLSYIPNGYKHEIYTEKGVKATIILPDSSRVLLNSDTRLVFPDRFTGSTREVFLSGEAFFEVASDSLVPMIVNTSKKFHIEVFGTTFNVRSYEDEEESQATLLSGQVNLVRNVGDKKENEVVTVLRPNESYIIKTDNTLLTVVDESDISKEIAWKDGKLIFELTPMKEIITKMERWHGVVFSVKDPEVMDYKITGSFKSESAIQIMEMIKFTSLIDYSIDGNRITLYKKHN